MPHGTRYLIRFFEQKIREAKREAGHTEYSGPDEWKSGFDQLNGAVDDGGVVDDFVLRQVYGT